MVLKKIDNRIRVLIENGIAENYRSMFVVIGEKARDQVVLLHHMLSKSVVKSRPSVLWCYKKDLGFSSHRKKRMKSIKKKVKSGKLNVDEDDPFEHFVVSTDIRYCYYNETHNILGKTYGMCILQDFEALTPNLLARTIETVEGGGLVVFLLQSVNSLKQLYTMNMDVHRRFRTEAHKDVVCRFNERFLLSLTSCNRCLVVDDQLRIIPISSQTLKIEPVVKSAIVNEQTQELNELKNSFQDTQPVSSLLNCCKTADQAKALLKFIEAISEKTLRSTVSLTAARGRGKSATLGLAIAGAVAFSYSNIYITSPSPENLTTLFEFIFKGFDALAYQEHLDYELHQSDNPEFNKAIVRVNIFRHHRQTIQYIHPTDAHKLSQAELLVIDEAAAIPLPYVKSMLGPYLVFLSSTINGYEGTGRSLSLKLLQQLRAQTATSNSNDKSLKKINENSVIGRQLHEITLEESIRYKSGDKVEEWLTNLLCLDATKHAPILSGCPLPDLCQLYYINRDTLFSYHKASELFLQRLVSLYVSSHYKNSPNDLQMMSDAPAHHLFCLLGPVDPNRKTLPEILVVIQVCLEGEISKSSVKENLGRGKRPSGDLIPWTISQQFNDNSFPKLAGARIVRIATHPDYQSMGYGKRAMKLLKQYYEMKIPNIDETTEEDSKKTNDDEDNEIDMSTEIIQPRTSLPSLLLKLSERRPERLDYIGVSYGLTEPLLKFWKKLDFVPVYVGQTTNDITGEHSCIMLSKVIIDEDQDFSWLDEYWADFRRRFVNLLSDTFAKYPTSLALSMLVNDSVTLKKTFMNKETLDVYFIPGDLKRLELYKNNMIDYRLIKDLVSTVAKIYFFNMMGNVELSALRVAILLGIGLQHKTIDDLSQELKLPQSQLLGYFNKMIIESVKYFNGIVEESIEKTLSINKNVNENIIVDAEQGEALQKELEDAARKLEIQQKKELEKLKKLNLEQYAIKGTEEEWNSVLKDKGSKSLISVKTGEKRLGEGDLSLNLEKNNELKKRKKKRFSK
ncbi:RNA cytidine acetyltransferase [Chelonus insularis]|uniref:RNA cytidine acetyltransferase n=1 Tax=Chelonus insularis TaxID=460826 RepID=UPI00158BCC70|nr:RNA cytidine acetyltransferase [Chelonus insularis]